MQLALFYLSEGDDEALKLCNQFLRSHKIISIKEELGSGDFNKWCVLIKYIGQPIKEESQERKDYREILNAEQFEKFAKYRDIRKIISDEQKLPVYIIFTNEELAKLSQLGNITLESMRSIDGIGAKKLEKFGGRFIELLNNTSQIET